MSDPVPPPVFSINVGTTELRQIAGVLAPIVGKKGGEARLRVDPDGIRVSSVDPGHTAMAVVTFSRALFDGYEIERPGVFAVDTAKLGELWKIPRGRAVFNLKLEGGRLVCRLGFLTRTMGTVEPDAVTDPKVPTVVPKATAEGLDPEALASALKGAAEISDHVTIHRTRKGLALEAEREAGYSEPAAQSSTDLSAAKVTGGGTSEYPLDFMGAIGTALKRADVVTLGWGTELPMKVDFRFDREYELGTLTGPLNRRRHERGVAEGAITGYYLVAPRVLNRDDEPTDFSGWYDWAMRTRLPSEPDYSAAAVDDVPDTVVRVALETAAAADLAADQGYAAECWAYPAKLEAYGAALAHWKTDVAEISARWKIDHPHSRTKTPTRRYLPQKPAGPPLEPRRSAPAPLFPSRYGTRAAEDVDHNERRELRSRNKSGTSWGPAPPPEPEPEVTVGAFEVPIIRLEAPTPGPGSVEAAAEAAEPEPPFMGTWSPSVAYAFARAGSEPAPEPEEAREPEPTVDLTTVDVDELEPGEPEPVAVEATAPESESSDAEAPARAEPEPEPAPSPALEAIRDAVAPAPRFRVRRPPKVRAEPPAPVATAPPEPQAAPASVDLPPGIARAVCVGCKGYGRIPSFKTRGKDRPCDVCGGSETWRVPVFSGVPA